MSRANGRFCLGLGLAFALAALSSANAADYPARPIRYVIGLPAGALGDIGARNYAEKLGRKLSTPVVVENRPGAGEVIALNNVASSAPDGYTLIHTSSNLETLPSISKAFTLDPLKDFTPITKVVQGLNVVMVNAALPVTTVEDLVAYLRANPGKINVAFASNFQRILPGVFKTLTGVDMAMISYKGTADGINAVISGESHLTFAQTASEQVKRNAESGRIKVLAVVGSKRSMFMPEIPITSDSRMREIRELGNIGGAGFWIGPMGPRGLPAEVVSAIHSASLEIARDGDFVKRNSALGFETIEQPPSPQTMAAEMAQSVQRLSKIASQLQIEAQ